MALPKPKVTPPPKVTPKPNIGDASLYVNLNPTPVANTLTSKPTAPPAKTVVTGPPKVDTAKFSGWSPTQIKDYMTNNSATWGGSDASGRALKSAENQYLGNQIGATYDKKYGWSYKDDPTDYFGIEDETARLQNLATTETDPTKKAFYGEQIKRLERQESKQFDGMDPNEIDTSINAYLAETVSPLQAQLAQAGQMMNLEIAQNNAQQNEALQGLNESQTVAQQDAINLQNRRGGFYSGGLDYQNAEINRTYGNQRGNIMRDTAQRNAEIQSRYGAMTTQLTQQISAMRSNAPNVIKARIQEAVLAKQKADNEAAELYGVNPSTGQYTADYQKQQADVKHTQTLDAIAKSKDARDELKTRLDAAEKVGVINDPTLAKILGVPVGTPTLSAKKLIEDVKYKTGMLGVAKQNANTSASRAATSAANTATDNARADSAKSRKELMDIWKATGKAPAGIEGVKPGIPWNGSSSGGSSSKTKTYTEKDVNDMAIQNSGGVRAWGELSAGAKSKARAEARKILGITPEKKKEPAKPAVKDGDINAFLKKK